MTVKLSGQLGGGDYVGRQYALSYMINIFVYTIVTHEIHAFELRIELPFYV